MNICIEKKKAGNSLSLGKVLNSIELKKKYTNILNEKTKKFNSYDDFKNSQTKFYHGTFTYFKDFSLSKVGSNTGWENAKYGLFFSDNKKSVEEFLEITGDKTLNNSKTYIKEVYLVFNKSLDLTLEGIFKNKEQAPLLLKLLGIEEKYTQEDALDFIDENIGLGEIAEFMDEIYHKPKHKAEILKAGYDSIISTFGRDVKGNVIKEFVVFYTQQIFYEDDLEKIYKAK